MRAPVVVVGASLGGLTALLLGLLAAPRVGGVYAQSGSFFQVRHDDSESSYRYFGRISRLVQTVLDMRHAEHPLVVGMSCGALEENAANNRDWPPHCAGPGTTSPCARWPTCTTTPRGATPSTPASPRSCAASGGSGRPVVARPDADRQGGVAWRPPACDFGCRARRRPRGRPPRHVGAAGAALPLRGRVGPRRRAQRHARRPAAPHRRRPDEPVLRRLARRLVVVRQRPPHRGARPAWGHLHRVAVDVVLPWVLDQVGGTSGSSRSVSRS